MNLPWHNPPIFTVVDLLIKLAVMALLAGFIARFSMFRHLLLIEQRGPRQKIQFAAFLGLPFMVGVLAGACWDLPHHRFKPGSDGTGRAVGWNDRRLGGGLIVNLPILMILMDRYLIICPVLAGASDLAIPSYRPECWRLMATLYAVVAGTPRWVCPDKEEIWKFSPLSI